jgi:hypothetical protein
VKQQLGKLIVILCSAIFVAKSAKKRFVLAVSKNGETVFILLSIFGKKRKH